MTTAPTHPPATRPAPGPREGGPGATPRSGITRRVAALDVIRGVALCGIMLVNIGPQTRFGTAAGFYEMAALGSTSGWLQLLVQQRFFPVFALLFGIGFALIVESAERRSARPRLVLLRRLLILLAIAIPFEFLQHGSALLPYALAGLVVLLPSTWLPRALTAVAAIALVVVSVVVAGGGLTLVPGMLLLGSALTRYGVVAAIGRARRGSAVVLVVALAAAVPLVAWQVTTIADSGFSTESAAAGLALAAAYVALLSLLMTTRAARALEVAFAPLGRMALTNYVLGAPLMLAAGAVLDLPHATSWTPMLLAVVVILVLQAVASALWLRAFAQGPLEWLWRWGTWGTRGPFRLAR